MRIWPCFAIAVAVAVPAQADITGTYRSVHAGIEMTMRVQVAANGDLRADMNRPEIYIIKHSGHAYFVMQMPEGPVVADVQDAAAVMQEEMKKLDPAFCSQVKEAAPSFVLTDRGEMTVAGRKGEAYASAQRTGSMPDVVISHDPELAPLGAALAAQFRLSTTLMGGVMGECMAEIPMFRQMQELLDSGTALMFGGMQLETVETGPIDPARFVLPAPPAPREKVRQIMMHKDAGTPGNGPRPAN